MIDAAWQRYAQWRDTRPDGWPEPAGMTSYRWLIEEFRVSLFAQRLGTAQPVSMKRLDEAWQQNLRDARA
jgi:ATP-dependent helicase HrpA